MIANIRSSQCIAIYFLCEYYPENHNHPFWYVITYSGWWFIYFSHLRSETRTESHIKSISKLF